MTHPARVHRRCSSLSFAWLFVARFLLLLLLLLLLYSDCVCVRTLHVELKHTEYPHASVAPRPTCCVLTNSLPNNTFDIRLLYRATLLSDSDSLSRIGNVISTNLLPAPFACHQLHIGYLVRPHCTTLYYTLIVISAACFFFEYCLPLCAHLSSLFRCFCPAFLFTYPLVLRTLLVCSTACACFIQVFLAAFLQNW